MKEYIEKKIVIGKLTICINSTWGVVY